jgi:hypothetical protein
VALGGFGWLCPAFRVLPECSELTLEEPQRIEVAIL